MERVLNASLSYVRQYKNSLRPINRLPTEIFAMVFRELQPPHYSYCDEIPGPSQHYQCIEVFSVCHYWRSVALGCSGLWTCIYVSTHTLDIAELFHNRSGQREVSLVVDGFNSRISPIRMQNLIKSCFKRAKKLAVIDSQLSNFSDFWTLGALTTLICQRSQLGSKELNSQTFDWSKLQAASFNLKDIHQTLERLPALTYLHINASADLVIRPALLINFLGTQPLLEEIIFERLPPFALRNLSLVSRIVLPFLKRLAFHHCHDGSIGYVTASFHHQSGLAIAINMVTNWSHNAKSTTISQFLANTIPTSPEGYVSGHIVVNLSQNNYHYALTIVLTGPETAYRLNTNVTPDTKDRILQCLGQEGRLKNLQKLWIPSQANLIFPRIFSWFRHLSQLSTLTSIWASLWWSEPKTIAILFAGLPSNLDVLVLHIPRFDDYHIAKSNFRNLIKLNEKRNHPLKIQLCFLKDTSKCFTRLDASNDVEVVVDDDPRLVEGFNLVATESDIMTFRHRYWPSWIDASLAEVTNVRRLVRSSD